MPNAAPPDDVQKQLEALRSYAHSRGAIMAISGHFCPTDTYWADIILPGYAILAHGPTPLHAALAAVAQFDHAQPA
jgi:hypothetical protein